VAAQFALTERLPAAGLAIVPIALARAARRSGAAGAARVALFTGGAAALISLLQFVVGAVMAGTTAPGTAHVLYDAVNRLDGVKMLALAILGLAGAASGVLPRWLRYTGIALAIAITAPASPTCCSCRAWPSWPSPPGCCCWSTSPAPASLSARQPSIRLGRSLPRARRLPMPVPSGQQAGPYGPDTAGVLHPRASAGRLRAGQQG
jgi:hypothetical protein